MTQNHELSIRPSLWLFVFSCSSHIGHNSTGPYSYCFFFFKYYQYFGGNRLLKICELLLYFIYFYYQKNPDYKIRGLHYDTLAHTWTMLWLHAPQPPHPPLSSPHPRLFCSLTNPKCLDLRLRSILAVVLDPRMSQDHPGNTKSFISLVECGFEEQLKGNTQGRSRVGVLQEYLEARWGAP